jgi:predicted PurR-regulated permease PerM
MDTGRLETYFFLLLLSLVLILTALVFLPYLSALLLAVILAVIMRPVYERLRRLLGGRESLAAFLVVLVVVAVVFTPLILFGVQIFQEATNLYLVLVGDSFSGAVRGLEEYLQSAFPGLSLSLGGYLRQFVSWLLQNMTAFFSGLAQIFITLLLCLLGLYYFLKDGERFKSRLIALLPLSPKYSQLIWERLTATVNSVIKGALFVALLQGVIAGTGFAIFGVPNPVFWGSLAVFAALIPMLGTSLVITPAIIYLFFNVGPAPALGLLLWGILAVGLIDNFLAPQLIKRGARIHPFLILLSVLGGLSLMGPIGFLAGPLLLSVLFALFDIYSPLILKRELHD